MISEYKLESCISLGFRWQIDAPTTLSPNEVEQLMDALSKYADHPTNDDLQSMLSDYGSYLDDPDYLDLKADRVDLYRAIDLHLECVHREVFTQSFEKPTNEEET